MVEFSGVTHIFSQHTTGCMSWRLAASVVARRTPILRLVAIALKLPWYYGEKE